MLYYVVDGPVMKNGNLLKIDDNDMAHLDNGDIVMSTLVFKDINIAKSILYEKAVEKDMMNPPGDGVKAIDLDINDEWYDLVFNSH